MDLYVAAYKPFPCHLSHLRDIGVRRSFTATLIAPQRQFLGEHCIDQETIARENGEVWQRRQSGRLLSVSCLLVPAYAMLAGSREDTGASTAYAGTSERQGSYCLVNRMSAISRYQRPAH